MSSLPVESHLGRATRFYDATVGKKAIMAVTGAILFAFVIGHLIGNLQVYEGAQKFNAYGLFLRSLPAALWFTRLTLLASVCLHILASVQLYRLKAAARPVAYVKKDNSHSSYASRTMMWSGPIVGAFVVYHLLHFTTGTLHQEFIEGEPYHNLVTGFQHWPVSLAYIVAIVLLGMHLYHGVYSMFQSLGAAHPSYTPFVKRFAAVVSVLIVVGYCSIPISVLAGIVHL